MLCLQHRTYKVFAQTQNAQLYQRRSNKMAHVILRLSRLFVISSHIFDTGKDVEYLILKP